MEQLVLVPYEKYQRLLDVKTMESSERKTMNPPKRHERTMLKRKGPLGERDKPSAATRYTIKAWISF